MDRMTDRSSQCRPAHVPICAANYLWTIHLRADALQTHGSILLFFARAVDWNTSNMILCFPLFLFRVLNIRVWVYECVVVCIMCGLRFGIRLMIRFLAFNCFRLYEKSSILAEKNMSFVFVFECNLEVRVFYVFLLKLTANHVFLSISQLIFVFCCRKILFEFDSHRVFYLTSVFTVSAISSRLLFFCSSFGTSSSR